MNKTPRQRRKKKNEESILDAATQQLYEKGIENISIREIAKEADYSPAALYKYFYSKEAIIQAAKIAQAHEFIQETSSGYDTPVGERGTTLSGGQKQRIAIARALLTNPRILILDDATSSVDTQTERLIQQALDRLMEGRTTFVIAHRLSTIRRADRILVLENGYIAAQGKHDELINSSSLYRRLYDLQLRPPDNKSNREVRL